MPPWLRLEPYEVRGSIRGFHDYGMQWLLDETPLSPAEMDEMEAAFPRDSTLELIAAFHFLHAGAKLRLYSLQQLGCPLLVTRHRRWVTSSHLFRHVLEWKLAEGTLYLIPQVSIVVVRQSRVPRVDFLVRWRNRWSYIEIDGPQHKDTPLADEYRAVGLSLKEVRYEAPPILRPDFAQRFLRDVL